MAMTRFSLEDAKRAWAQAYEGLDDAEIGRRALGFRTIVRGIAARGSVSPAEFAHELGLEESAARELFLELVTAGMEVDDAGNITAAALTTRPTPHFLRMNGRTLYAWCALDTLFIPGLVGEKMEVESRCPVSDTVIRLSVSPHGVLEHSPEGAVLSVFLPGASGASIGLASPT